MYALLKQRFLSQQSYILSLSDSFQNYSFKLVETQRFHQSLVATAT
jgi:hypothetical protein